VDEQSEFQDKIKALREAQGWSLREAAKRIGKKGTPLSYVLLGDFERGRAHTSGKPIHPPRVLVVNMAKAYETSVDELLELAGYLPLNYKRNLSADESWLLDAFRALPPLRQRLLLSLTRTLSEE
jgi:transcriptional regulator with XRE-family HTH domain